MKDVHGIPWIERAKETQRFHAEKRRLDKKWRISDTAKVLNRSSGSVSEDLLIASWLKTHESKLITFDRVKDALEWIRMKEDERASEEGFQTYGCRRHPQQYMVPFRLLLASSLQ